MKVKRKLIDMGLELGMDIPEEAEPMDAYIDTDDEPEVEEAEVPRRRVITHVALMKIGAMFWATDAPGLRLGPLPQHKPLAA